MGNGTRLKAQWLVQAGVIPGTPDAELTKVWYYTSEEYQKDMELAESTPGDEPVESIYRKLQQEAREYYFKLENPAGVNWVKLEFIWL